VAFLQRHVIGFVTVSIELKEINSTVTVIGRWFTIVSNGEMFAVIEQGFYPRDAMLARVIVIACLSVCRNCVKTKKASGMISSPSDSPKTLVF